MAGELKACRNCGGQCDPKGWMCGDGRQGPECEGCGITTPDVESWNRLMGEQSASQGGEAVEVVAWLSPETVEAVIPGPGHQILVMEGRAIEPLMTVAQHQRILAASVGSGDPVAWLWYEQANEFNGYEGKQRISLTKPKGRCQPLYTHPADQVDSVVVSRELLEQWANDLALHGVGDIETAQKIDALLAKP